MADWDLTPQEAFQKYQIKSIDAWKHSSPPDVYYFYISVWRGENRVVLVKRTLKDSDIIQEIALPAHMVDACLAREGGDKVRSGQYAVDDGIRAWLQARLGI